MDEPTEYISGEKEERTRMLKGIYLFIVQKGHLIGRRLTKAYQFKVLRL